MTFSRRLAEQLARPSGRAGRLLGRAMDVANRRPLRLAVDLLAPRAGERILDAGCGTGAAMAQMLERAPCRPTGVDVSPEMLGVARRRLGTSADYFLGAIATISASAAPYDAILALNVLYFDDADASMVRALHRLLRPGGRLVGYVTDRATMDGWAFAGAGLHRLYDRHALAEAMCNGGFAPDAVRVQEVRITASVQGLLVHAER